MTMYKYMQKSNDINFKLDQINNFVNIKENLVIFIEISILVFII